MQRRKRRAGTCLPHVSCILLVEIFVWSGKSCCWLESCVRHLRKWSFQMFVSAIAWNSCKQPSFCNFFILLLFVHLPNPHGLLAIFTVRTGSEQCIPPLFHTWPCFFADYPFICLDFATRDLIKLIRTTIWGCFVSSSRQQSNHPICMFVCLGLWDFVFLLFWRKTEATRELPQKSFSFGGR